DRFHPRAHELAEVVDGLQDQEPEGLPSVVPLRTPDAADPSKPSVLLLHEDDCRPEDFDLSALTIGGAATLAGSHLRSPQPVSPRVTAFETGAVEDTGARMGLSPTPLVAGVPGDLARWASQSGATQIVTPYVPTGPLGDWLCEARAALDAAGITLVELRRDWDALIWPHATAGFFKVKKKIPSILEDAGLLHGTPRLPGL
ncbi:MAG: deoxyribodipyrimidine photolyase, partial [Pseudomonadota bacterium]